MCSRGDYYDDPVLDDVLYDERTLVLYPKGRWNPPQPMPKGWTWNTETRTLKLSQQDFVSTSGSLGKNNFSAVILAGFISFKCRSPTRSVVQSVLGSCTKVTVIHNKDLITTLLALFPRLEELVLPHNMRLQCPMDLDDADLPTAWDRPLRSIRGDCCGIGINHLLMDRQLAVYLHIKFRELVHIDASVEEAVDMIGALSIIGQAPKWQTYILGSCRQRSTLDNIVVHTGITAGPLANALSFSKKIHRLQIVTMSADVVKMIACFESIKSLSVTFIQYFCLLDSCLLEMLKKFTLEELELRYFRDVKLSEALKHSPNIRTLSLLDCVVCDEELGSQTFHHLKVLRLGNETAFSLFEIALVSERMLRTLIERCPNLKELQLSGTQLCRAFLQPQFKKSALSKLRKLVLWTKETAKGLELSASDLHALLKDLPTLDRVVTDSYDIRLFVGAYAPHIRLEWLSCTKCAAEFPEVNGIEFVRNAFFSDICK